MFITGNPYSDVLNFLTVILPIISLAIILFRKEYTHDTITFVMILCIFFFIQRVLFTDISKFGIPPKITHNVFNGIEFMLMAVILKVQTTSTRFRYILNGFLIAYISSIITYYAILGFTNDELLLRGIQYGLMIIMMGVAIARQWQKQSLEMMNSPLFWFCMSTLFYFTFCLFWEAGKVYLFNTQETASLTSAMFMKIAAAIRFVMFTFAIWFLEPTEETRPYEIRQGMRIVINGRDYEPDQRRFEVGETFSITG
jgi:hypothetical protein